MGSEKERLRGEKVKKVSEEVREERRLRRDGSKEGKGEGQAQGKSMTDTFPSHRPNTHYLRFAPKKVSKGQSGRDKQRDKNARDDGFLIELRDKNTIRVS